MRQKRADVFDTLRQSILFLNFFFALFDSGICASFDIRTCLLTFLSTPFSFWKVLLLDTPYALPSLSLHSLDSHDSRGDRRISDVI